MPKGRLREAQEAFKNVFDGGGESITSPVTQRLPYATSGRYTTDAIKPEQRR
jgi:hypothetical protein